MTNKKGGMTDEKEGWQTRKRDGKRERGMANEKEE
jgi:hypothetical protein